MTPNEMKDKAICTKCIYHFTVAKSDLPQGYFEVHYCILAIPPTIYDYIINTAEEPPDTAFCSNHNKDGKCQSFDPISNVQ